MALLTVRKCQLSGRNLDWQHTPLSISLNQNSLVVLFSFFLILSIECEKCVPIVAMFNNYTKVKIHIESENTSTS